MSAFEPFLNWRRNRKHYAKKTKRKAFSDNIMQLWRIRFFKHTLGDERFAAG